MGTFFQHTAKQNSRPVFLLLIMTLNNCSLKHSKAAAWRWDPSFPYHSLLSRPQEGASVSLHKTVVFSNSFNILSKLLWASVCSTDRHRLKMLTVFCFASLQVPFLVWEIFSWLSDRKTYLKLKKNYHVRQNDNPDQNSVWQRSIIHHTEKSLTI